MGGSVHPGGLRSRGRAPWLSAPQWWRPKGHFNGKGGLRPKAPEHLISRSHGDIDKLLRATLDALSISTGGSLLSDDSLVVRVRSSKCYCVEGEPACGNKSCPISILLSRKVENSEFLSKPRQRDTVYHNRNQVQAKLDDALYLALYKYCAKEKLNINSFLKITIAYYLKNHG